MGDSKPEKYEPSTLTDAEKERFVAALGDGFGFSPRALRSQLLEEYPLPAEVEAGLLRHRAYYDKRRLPEGGHGDEPDKFWKESDGDSPPAIFEQCPVNFEFAAIRKYFLEQKMAYLGQLTSQRGYAWLDKFQAEERKNWESELYSRALYKTYSKAWYEYHINLQLYFIDEFMVILNRQSDPTVKNIFGFEVVKYSATLGRLIEQYYWKFLIEKAAIRGEKTYESAKSGGHLRAALRKQDQVGWHSAARLVWQDHPKMSKMAVASIVKRRLKLNQSIKHISRTLTKPQ